MKQTLTQKGLFLVSCILVLELALVGLLAGLLSDAEQQIEEERHIRDIITHLYLFSSTISDATNGLLVQLDLRSEKGSKEFHDTYYKHIDQMNQDLPVLKSFFHDATELDQIGELVDTCNEGMALMERYRVAYQKQEPQEHLLKISLQMKLDDVTRLSKRILAEYQKKQALAASRQEQSRSNLKSYLVTGVALNVVLALFVSLLFTRGITQRLKILSDNSVRLAANAPLLPALEGNDEISLLDKAFRFMGEEMAESARIERAVVENALDVICTIDINDVIAAVNPACSTMLGYAPEELIGRRYSDLVVEADRKKTRSALAKIVQEETSVPIENRLKRKDGSTVDALWSAHWSPAEKSLFCVIHDISSRREVERLKQQFVDMVSHDLKTPLSAIKGTLSLLDAGIVDLADPEGKEKMHEAQKSADRLMRLVNDLLDIERLEGGQLTNLTELVELKSVIASSIDSVKTLAHEKNQSIIIQADDAVMIGDEDRLVQVLVNLLSNAVKFSPDGSKIEVEGKQHEDMVEVKVKDQGRGVSPESKQVLFQRFRQIESRDEKHGSGLGLAIARAIIEAHGGTIGVESEEGNGSIFWFRVPLANDLPVASV